MELGLNRLALSATTHCLTGCAIGEILGMVIATALGWGDVASIALAVVLAYCFGYLLTIRTLIGLDMAFGTMLGIAFAADTVSITIMEIVDNAVIVAWPDALQAGLRDWIFWASLALGLAIAFVVTLPVNRWLIARGRGHAAVHAHH